jgi:hypothetical protein
MHMKFLSENMKGRAPLGGNIRIDLRDIGWGGGHVDWMHLAQNRDSWWSLVNTVLNLWVP